MEIKPLRSHHLPKYAAALAAVTAAVTLTGCTTGGEVATEGVAPAPVVTTAGDSPQVTAPYHDTVELDGDMVVEPDTLAETDASVTEHDSVCETCPTDAETKQVILSGDVAVIEESSDFICETECVETQTAITGNSAVREDQ